MRERFVEALIAVGVIDVLAHHADHDFALGLLNAAHDFLPDGEVSGRRIKTELFTDDVVHALRVQHEGHFVNGLGVGDADHAVHRDVAEESDLGAFAFGNVAFGAAKQEIGVHTLFSELLHGVLRGLGFEFPGSGHIRAQRQMHKAGVAAAHTETHLAHRFNERQRLNVAHRAADFHNGDVTLSAAGIFGSALDEFLDFVGDVGNHLNGLAEVFAAAFLLKNALIDLTGREVVIAVHLRGDETLIVAEVKVGLRAVIGDEDLAVLVRAHGTRVDVDVRIKLDHRHLESAGLQKCRQRSGGDAFTQTGDNAAGHEYIFSHSLFARQVQKLHAQKAAACPPIRPHGP